MIFVQINLFNYSVLFSLSFSFFIQCYFSIIYILLKYLLKF